MRTIVVSWFKTSWIKNLAQYWLKKRQYCLNLIEICNVLQGIFSILNADRKGKLFFSPHSWKELEKIKTVKQIIRSRRVSCFRITRPPTHQKRDFLCKTSCSCLWLSWSRRENSYWGLNSAGAGVLKRTSKEEVGKSTWKYKESFVEN